MRGRQTVLWTGIGLVGGVVCLGAEEPQPSKGGKAMLSAESSRGRDGAPMVFIASVHSPWVVTTALQTSGLNIP